jgi:hypothetical protein
MRPKCFTSCRLLLFYSLVCQTPKDCTHQADWIHFIILLQHQTTAQYCRCSCPVGGRGTKCLLRRSNPQVRACTSGLKIAADYTRMGNPTNLAMQTRGMRGNLAFMRLLSWLYLKMSCKQKCFSSKLCYFIPVPLVATFVCSGRSLCVFIIKTESLHGTRGGFRPLQL